MFTITKLGRGMIASLMASSCLVGSHLVAQTINDPCFTSPAISTTFASTANIANNNSDCLRWTGTAWTGNWPGANITLAPPGSVAGTRAIWSGDGTVWTSGGEGFGLRLSSGLSAGVTYTFTYTRVSHGTGSAGSFAPRLYTNSTGTFGYLVGNIPTAGTSWFTGPITFTAVAAQAGHTFIYFHTNTPNGSGMFLACEATVLPMRLWNLRGWQSDDGNIVQWNAADEEGYTEHVLESSIDGIEYRAVGSTPVIQGIGDHLYTLTDASGSGARFYRVRTRHHDGESAESPTIEIRSQHGSAELISIAPNPVQNGQPVNVEVFCPEAQTLRLSLADIQGRVLWQHEQAVPEGFSSLALENLPTTAGLHWLTISGNGWSKTLTLSLQN